MGAHSSDIVALETFASSSPPFRLAVIGTWPPRRCGIASFTSDMVDACRAAAPRSEIAVYALSRDVSTHVETVTSVADGREFTYTEAGRELASGGYDAVWVQHEFGIFDGPAGDGVIDLLGAVAAPIIVTFHTVLDQPNAAQERVLAWFALHAARIVVMSEHAAQILLRRGDIDADRIVLIEHGVPDRAFAPTAPAKRRFNLPDGPVLLTFGLLSPGKGIEVAIEALAQVVPDHPNLVYVIAGVTHPDLIASEGEAYRERVQAKAEALDVARNIVWLDEYLELDELLELISAADIYLTPYPGAAQATSGTLSYAVALGKAVVSTPYVHAAELLRDDIGVLTPFNDAGAMARAITALLGDPDALARLQRRAYRRGRAMIWPAFAARTIEVIEEVRPRRRIVPSSTTTLADDDLERLCDDTGMFQHSVLAIPDRAHGYCVDDNARALILANLAQGRYGQRAPTFAAFIQHAWNPELRRFRNFMGFDRQWCEEAGSEDSSGRTLWAIGATVHAGCSGDLRHWAAQLWSQSAAIALDFEHLRAIAFAMLGADQVLSACPDDALARSILQRGGDRLAGALQANSADSRTWYEAHLSYDNCRLAEAHLAAAERLDDPDAAEQALAALRWICAVQTAEGGWFRPVGSESFGDPALPPLPFDQQPVDAWATVDAAARAWRLTGTPRWRAIAEGAYAWFFGANDRALPLADRLSGSCHDGLTPHGINGNRGAESVLALHLAAHALASIQAASPRRERPYEPLPALAAG